MEAAETPIQSDDEGEDIIQGIGLGFSFTNHLTFLLEPTFSLQASSCICTFVFDLGCHSTFMYMRGKECVDLNRTVLTSPCTSQSMSTSQGS